MRLKIQTITSGSWPVDKKDEIRSEVVVLMKAVAPLQSLKSLQQPEVALNIKELLMLQFCQCSGRLHR